MPPNETKGGNLYGTHAKKGGNTTDEYTHCGKVYNSLMMVDDSTDCNAKVIKKWLNVHFIFIIYIILAVIK